MGSHGVTWGGVVRMPAAPTTPSPTTPSTTTHRSSEKPLGARRAPRRQALGARRAPKPWRVRAAPRARRLPLSPSPPSSLASGHVPCEGGYVPNWGGVCPSHLTPSRSRTARARRARPCARASWRRRGGARRADRCAPPAAPRPPRPTARKAPAPPQTWTRSARRRRPRRRPAGRAGPWTRG
eukprot:929005-Prymnesium_polylepis.1